jgi:hypothetical protein
MEYQVGIIVLFVWFWFGVFVIWLGGADQFSSIAAAGGIQAA